MSWKLPVALAALLFSVHFAAQAVTETFNSSDLPVRRNLIQGDDDDNLRIPSLDIFAEGNFANYGGGTDTISLTGNGGNFSAVEIHSGGRFRNFERIELSDDEDTGDTWSVGENDNGLEYIDARLGNDTVAFGDGNHNAANISASGRYRNFERATLSDNNNVWSVSDNDRELQVIDALSNGEMGDTISFGDGSHNAANINSSDGLYRNFERAILSSGNNSWTIGDNDGALEFIDALGGTDTVALGDGSHSAANINSSDGLYRNFERATLSSGNNSWTIGDNDGALESIDALGGTDTLENSLTDAQEDGMFNSSDSSFSTSNLGAGAFGNYSNFEQVAIGLTGEGDIWTSSADDFGARQWQWINGGEGTDTLVFGDGDHSAANTSPTEFYRNFEQAVLSNNSNIWTAGENDRNLEFIDALGGADTVELGDGNHGADEMHSEGRYRNFERATLSDNDNIWSVSENDEGLEVIDALGNGAQGDTIAFGDGDHSADETHAAGRYRNFELAVLSGGDNAWAVGDNDGELESIDALEGTDTLENPIADKEGGMFNASDSTFSEDDLNSETLRRYLNFEQVALGLTGQDNTWTVSEADFNGAKEWQWINARDGFDTVALGDGNHNAANISSDGLYRNFEQVTLSDNNNIWSVSENDGELEVIDALGNGAQGDTIAFGDGNHSAANISSDGRYRNFERATLSGGDNIWTVGDNDRNLEFIDALGGADTAAFGDGNHSAANINSSDGLYRNFEQAALSGSDNEWTVSDNDGNLEFIDALGGADTVVLGDGNHNATDISSDGRYRNFERAALSDNENVWTVGDNDRTLESIDALGGADTVVFGDGDHSADETHATGRYRNFERAVLSDGDNAWAVGDNDRALESIDALGGTDTLENSITDREGDGVFNASDSEFSTSDLGAGEFAKYSNFERVAIGLTGGGDTWTASEADFNGAREWQWINARNGFDTVAFGDGNHNAANINSSDGLYRNFERATLSDNNNIWSVSNNDRELDIIDALSNGTEGDTISFGDGNHNAANINSSDGLYRNFERATLSDNNNIWSVSNNDRELDIIDALSNGTEGDTISFGDGNHSATNINSSDGLYRNFERATLSDNNNIWTVGNNDRELDIIDALSNGTEGDTISFGDGNHNATNINSSDGLYRNFERATLSDNNNIWSVSNNDRELDIIDALSNGTEGDTISFGDGNHSATNINSSDGLYRNFERATLSDNDNTWTVGNNDRELQFIDALSNRAQGDTVSFGDGSHSAENINSSDGLYRNFERATLSDNSNIWTVGDNDRELQVIDALAGIDTLESAVTDREGDGMFNASDSAFSTGDLGVGEFANYSNFEQVAIGLTQGNDVWTVSSADNANFSSAEGWQWVNARGGTDTIALGDGNHSAANINSSDGRYRNFERVSLSDGDNTWTVGDNDGALEFITASGGTDTITFGNGSHSAANINSSDGLYRNFERVTLSEMDDIWAVGENDNALESINASGGFDTLEDSLTGGDGRFDASDSTFSTSDLCTAEPCTGRFANYSNFEQVAIGLTQGNDVWTVSSADNANFSSAEGWQWVNARGGTDTIALGDGNHSAANINSSDGRYRNFERATLSDGDNTWTVGDNDGALEFINASGGTDTIAFGDGNHNAANINSSDGRYRNFERATLSDGDNIWTVGDNDEALEFISASGGTDTVSFGNGSHSAENINSSDGRYRNFERVTLSEMDDIWAVGENDNALESIDALGNTSGGFDTLEDSLTGGDGMFDASDSTFSTSDLCTAEPCTGRFANYSNFERVAIGLTQGDDVWTVSSADNDNFNSEDGWQWVNARGGTDTIAFGDGDHSAANIGSDRRYRNFEQATLSDGNNVWTVMENDEALTFIDALGGTGDTVALGDGNHSAANISSDGRYRNFERATLSDNDNIWTVGENDQDLEFIDALGGIDTVNAAVTADNAMTLNGGDFGANALYGNFESVRKTGEGTLSIERRLQLENGGGVSIEAGNLVFQAESANVADWGKIVAERISASGANSIAVNGLDIVALSETEDGSFTVFEGSAEGIAVTVLADSGLFADLSVCPRGICLSIDSEDGAGAEIDGAVDSVNTRELLRTVHRALRAGMVDRERSGIVNALNNRRDEQAVRNLVPTEHGGVNHEVIDIQRTLFESIEEEIVEAVEYKPWDDSSKPGLYRVFAGGFEKTSSADTYNIGSRGLAAGIHRLLFDERLGVGIAGAASFMETRRQRVTEETDGLHGALYAKYKSGRFSASAIASLGALEYESSRSGGSLSGNINGKADMKVYGTKVSGGLEILKNLPARIKPELSLMLARVSTDEYTETGGLGIRLQNNSMTSFEAGAKVHIAFNSLKTILQTVVQPEIEAGVYYDFPPETII